MCWRRASENREKSNCFLQLHLYPSLSSSIHLYPLSISLQYPSLSSIQLPFSLFETQSKLSLCQVAASLTAWWSWSSARPECLWLVMARHGSCFVDSTLQVQAATSSSYNPGIPLKGLSLTTWKTLNIFEHAWAPWHFASALNIYPHYVNLCQSNIWKISSSGHPNAIRIGPVKV